LYCKARCKTRENTKENTKRITNEIIENENEIKIKNRISPIPKTSFSKGCFNLNIA
jgi:hypothetical protein